MIKQEPSVDYSRAPIDATSAVLDNIVAVARSERPDYGSLSTPVQAPEHPEGQVRTVAALALRRLFEVWGLDRENAGTRQWNPLGMFVGVGSKVLVKPNWVFHRNKSGETLDCLLTHTTIIDALLDYLALARPGSVVIGDAPVQGCDFQILKEWCSLDAIAERARSLGLDLTLCDFRRTVLAGDTLSSVRTENLRTREHYILFDLGRHSLLEPLASDNRKFRVTMYDPDLMHQTHSAGKHQYLIAREVIEADTVINLPKLKCHKKAGITGALKNVVGINGNKEYLPHHRKGGEAEGGDCYPGMSWLKHLAEDALDSANREQPGRRQRILSTLASVLLRSAQLIGADGNLDGSWHGNDTVWRMCLDLQRILRYGREDGTLAETPQRRLITITDAIIAGEGEGPISPTPVGAGFMTGALNPAAADWAHARLMGFDPRKISLTREAFAGFDHSLAAFPPDEIRVLIEEEQCHISDVHPLHNTTFRPAMGWQGHCELEKVR